MVDHAELVQRLGETPARVRALQPSPDPADHEGWPAQVILGHITYVEQHVWLPRLREMATVDRPQWDWWEPAGVDWLGLYGEQSWVAVVEDFAAARAATVAYLTDLPEAGWSRHAHHTVFGDLAVAGLCEEILAHDNDHLAQLRGHGHDHHGGQDSG